MSQSGIGALDSVGSDFSRRIAGGISCGTGALDLSSFDGVLGVTVLLGGRLRGLRERVIFIQRKQVFYKKKPKVSIKITQLLTLIEQALF